MCIATGRRATSMACFNALADDDNDSSDNRVTTNGYQVK